MSNIGYIGESLCRSGTPKIGRWVMRENQIEKYLFEKAKEVGALPWKFTSPGMRGVPDRVIVFIGGWTVFVELKRPGGSLRRQQEYRIKQLRDRGALARVISNKDGVDKLINDWRAWYALYAT